MIVGKTCGSFGNPLNSNLVEKPVQEENRYLFPRKGFSKELHWGIGNEAYGEAHVSSSCQYESISIRLSKRTKVNILKRDRLS